MSSRSLRKLAGCSLCLLVASACSDSADPYDRGVSPSSGDFGRPIPTTEQVFASCEQGPAPALSLRCAAPAVAPRGVLSVCGNLTADNTLAVQASPGAIALWVQGLTQTSAPLSVTGDFIAVGGNEARNTQTLSSPVQSAPALDCQSAPEVTRFLEGLTSADPVSLMPGDDELDGDEAYRGAVRISEPTERTLSPCHYVLSALAVDNTLTVHVSGHVSWFITGDVRIAAPTRIELDPGATLELVIGGALQIDNTLDIGAADRPEATWLAVGQTITVAAPTSLHGSLLAPDSDVAANNTLAIQGSAYLGSLRVAAPMTVTGEGGFSAAGCSSP